MLDPKLLDIRVDFFGQTVCFETAKRNRYCRAYQVGCTQIGPGDQHLAIYKGDPPMRDNYCLTCAKSKLKQVITDARTALDSTMQALSVLDEIDKGL